jgi:hypothetical protein
MQKERSFVNWTAAYGGRRLNERQHAQTSLCGRRLSPSGRLEEPKTTGFGFNQQILDLTPIFIGDSPQSPMQPGAC